MSSGGKFEWRGDQIVAEVKRKAKRGIDVTLAACVVMAKQTHPWKNVTGAAEGSIQMRPAEEVGGGRIRGFWGSFDLDYFIFLEIGTVYMGARPVLRPTADYLYRTLAKRIAGA